MTPEALLSITEWTVAQGLEGTPETALLPGFCERLGAARVPLLRVNVYQPTLHPLIGGHLFIWRRGGSEAVREDWDRNVMTLRGDQPTMPFEHMILNRLPTLRQRLDAATPAFALLARFRDEGATDYFALQSRFGAAHALGSVDRILTSWLTDEPGGFSDAHIAAIERLAPALALAAKGCSSHRIADTVIATYLGRDAGRRVLSGTIERGAGETIRAALWYFDIEGFTKLADRLPRDRLLAMLDAYFECVVTTVHEAGGQVLKFTGDGLLAIFALGDDAASCGAALAAAERALERLEALRAARREAGEPDTGFYLVLHLGDVLYGNIGARDRLDFTVVGPAVNEVSRIEAMCRALDQTIVVSASFAAAAKGSDDRLVSLGRYALRGVRRAQELFTLDRG